MAELRAVVTESGGEISASVEETNRLRAQLGLRPLDVGASASTRREVVVHLDTEAAKVAEQEDVRARIERARRDREAAAAAQSKSLGDVLKGRATSAADWVLESRRREAADKARAARVAALHVDEEGGAGGGARGAARRGPAAAAGAELDGMRIHHGADDFELGESAVLTLADRPLLDERGTGLSTRDDELVNADLLAAERAGEANERRANARKPTYSGRDDDVDDWGASAGAGPGAPGAAARGILPQYNDGPTGAALGAAAGGGLVIGAGGSVADPTAGDRVKARLAAAAAARTQVDASSTLGGGGGSGDAAQLRIATDYLTPAEVAAAAASRAAARKRRKVRKAGTAGGDDDDGGGGGSGAPAAAHAPSAALALAPLPAAPGDAGDATTRDRGSRAARRGEAGARAAADAAAAVADGRAAAFDAALSKAEFRSAAALGAAPPTAGTSGGAGASLASRGGPLPAAAGTAGGEGDALDAARLSVLAAGASSVGTAGASTRVSTISGQRVYTRLRAAGDGGGDGGGDDDAELNAALARARRVAQSQHARAAASAGADGPAGAPSSDRGDAGGGGGLALAVPDDGGDAAGRAVAALMHEAEGVAAARRGPAAAASGGDGGGGMVFTDTTEFAHLLEGRLHDRQREAADAADAAAAAAAATAEVDGAHAANAAPRAAGAGAEAHKKRLRGDADGDGAPPRKRRGAGAGAAAAAVAGEGDASSSWVRLGADGNDAEAGGGGGDDDDDDGDDGDDDGDGGEEDDDDEAAAAFTGREPSAASGVAGALALFARTGALATREMYRGRTKDVRPEWDVHQQQPARGPGGAAGAAAGELADIPVGMHDVVLEYRDKAGNKLTPKEAYRELCYKFHGRQPSQKTRDKRLKAMKREQALAKASTADTPLGSLSALQRTQEARGTAHIVMGK